LAHFAQNSGGVPKVLERVSFELGQQKGQFRVSMQPPAENPLMTIENFNRHFQGWDHSQIPVETPFLMH
jgi:hypothetical protein